MDDRKGAERIRLRSGPPDAEGGPGGPETLAPASSRRRSSAPSAAVVPDVVPGGEGRPAGHRPRVVVPALRLVERVALAGRRSGRGWPGRSPAPPRSHRPASSPVAAVYSKPVITSLKYGNGSPRPLVGVVGAHQHGGLVPEHEAAHVVEVVGEAATEVPAGARVRSVVSHVIGIEQISQSDQACRVLADQLVDQAAVGQLQVGIGGVGSAHALVAEAIGDGRPRPSTPRDLVPVVLAVEQLARPTTRPAGERAAGSSSRTRPRPAARAISAHARSAARYQEPICGLRSVVLDVHRVVLDALHHPVPVGVPAARDPAELQSPTSGRPQCAQELVVAAELPVEIQVDEAGQLPVRRRQVPGLRTLARAARPGSSSGRGRRCSARTGCCGRTWRWARTAVRSRTRNPRRECRCRSSCRCGPRHPPSRSTRRRPTGRRWDCAGCSG